MSRSSCLSSQHPLLGASDMDRKGRVPSSEPLMSYSAALAERGQDWIVVRDFCDGADHRL